VAMAASGLIIATRAICSGFAPSADDRNLGWTR
jgi:hypothetical protein